MDSWAGHALRISCKYPVWFQSVFESLAYRRVHGDKMATVCILEVGFLEFSTRSHWESGTIVVARVVIYPENEVIFIY